MKSKKNNKIREFYVSVPVTHYWKLTVEAKTQEDALTLVEAMNIREIESTGEDGGIAVGEPSLEDEI